jgi:energy-converting hydrogenase Eha subunit B
MSTQEFTDALKRPGWLTFAAVVLLAVGCLRAISAIYYFADSARINDVSNGAFSDHLWLWGLWDAGIAVLALWAGYSLLSGDAFGRVIGYIWAIVVVVQSMLILSWAPWYGFAGLLLAILVIYALSTTSDWREST